MKTLTVAAKTIEDAILDGLNQLGVTRDQVQIEVLEQPSKGLFGFGNKEAKVALSVIEGVTEKKKAKVAVSSEVYEEAKKFLVEALQAMGLEVSVEIHHDGDQVRFDVHGPSLSQMIGRRGQTLDALQYLTNLVANKYDHGHARIVLDAENYRARRQKTLEQLAQRLASNVVKSQNEVVLEPMSPAERKIIHAYLQEHPKVTTYSSGEEPNRRIVIALR